MFPPDAVALAVPIVFAQWWDLTEQCSGIAADLTSVRWFVVESQTLVVRNQAYDGYWYRDGNRIVLAAPHVLDGAVVRHEMLHALLQSGDHPLDQFTDRCGGVVAFGDPLRRDPASNQIVPGPESPIIDVSTLLISGAVTPSPVSIGPPDSAWASASVSITNPGDEAVWIRLTRIDSLNPYYRTFEIKLVSPDGLIVVRDARFFADSLMPFGPHETKRQVFDRQLSPRTGAWQLTAIFNGRAGAGTIFSMQQ